MTTGRWSNWCCGRSAMVTAVVIVVVTAMGCSAINRDEDNSDLTGSYCASRARGGCCKNRQDECTAPILGTKCYCDDFCDRAGSNDCCPDFWSHCRGEINTPKTPAPYHQRCFSNGQYYNFGETVNVNCNECRCQELNGKEQLMCSNHKCLIDLVLLDKLRREGHKYGWSAGNYSEFWGRKYEDGLSLRLGSLQSKKKIMNMKPLKVAIRQGSLPRSYDLREHWGRFISQPIDQGWCGASWAITTAQVTSDRFAIMSKGAVSEILSPQHLLSCNTKSQEGCQGGYLTRAWTWIRKFGLVTEDCFPWEGQMTECKVLKKRKELIASCPSTSRQKTNTQLRRVGPVYRVATIDGIMHEIKTSGSVQAVMKVSREFFMYKSGIYKCSELDNRSRTGYHSVRIVGWGEDYQRNVLVQYWIVANSWGRWWGENGYFRIEKGQCQIEEFVIAAWADIDDFNVTIHPQGYDIFQPNYLKANTI